MATRKTAAKTAAKTIAPTAAEGEKSAALTDEQMREAIGAISGSIRNGMTQEQIEAMAREQYARMHG